MRRLLVTLAVPPLLAVAFWAALTDDGDRADESFVDVPPADVRANAPGRPAGFSEGPGPGKASPPGAASPFDVVDAPEATAGTTASAGTDERSAAGEALARAAEPGSALGSDGVEKHHGDAELMLADVSVGPTKAPDERATIDSGTTRPELATASARAQDPTDASDRPDGPGTIVGIVLSVRGEPVSDLGITVERKSGDEALVAETNTDTVGRFALDGLPPGDYLVHTEETLLYAARTVRLRSGADVVTIVVASHDFARLAGTVQDESGAPIPGATILSPATGERTRTDENGGFAHEFTTLEGQGLLLRYEADDHLAETRYFAPDRLRGEETLDAGVVLRHGVFAFGGYVVDERGESVEHALVQIDSEHIAIHQSTQTDESGRFDLDGVLAADDYRVRISASARHLPHVAENLSLGPGGGELNVTLSEAPAGRLSATVLDPSGLPVPNVSLLALGAGDRAATVASDEHGHFVLDEFVAGELSLRSRAAPGILIEGIVVEPGQERSLTLVVDIGEHVLAGTVSNVQGFPVPNATLAMRWYRDEGGVRSTTARRTVSEADGTFRFGGLGAGPRKLEISAADLSVATLEFDPAMEPGPVAISLSR